MERVRQNATRAVILAGGSSRRFGSDKLDAVLDGRSVLERTIDSVRSVVDDVTVVGRRFPHTGFISDPEPRRGPLAAMGFAFDRLTSGPVAGADAARSQDPAPHQQELRNAVLVTAADHPFLVPGLLSLLIESLDDHDAVVPIDQDGHVQPLVAVYRISLSDAINAAVTDGRRSVTEFLHGQDVRWIEPHRWIHTDPDGMSFRDIDTTEDLRRLIRVAKDP